MKTSLLFVLAQMVFFTLLTKAQPWKPAGNGTNGGVHGMTTWNDVLVLGGSFGNPCSKVAMWDTVAYNCFGSGVGIVARAAIEFDGDLIVVGDFWNVQQPCVGCNGVARWDGTQWHAMGTGFNNDVLALALWNGELIAAGDFTKADGVTCHRIAKWDGTGWTAIGGITTAFDSEIRAMAVYNGELWVGGDFMNANGCAPCNRLAKWNGSAWVSTGLPNGVDSTVRALFVDPQQNKIYIGGHFTELAGDTNANGIAAYDGTTWSSLGTGVRGKGAYVRAITSYNDDIVIGGFFSHVNETVNAKRVARWNPWLSAWSGIGDGLKGGYVRTLHVYNGELYAGGSFNYSGTDTVSYIARWRDPAGVIISTQPPAAIGLSATVSPNPFTHSAEIVVRQLPREAMLLVYDVSGRQVAVEATRNDSGFTISRGNLEAGLYFYRVSASSGLTLIAGKLLVH